tara:strand:- start:499 stop:1224 length:726 start_codon:yes stop_codon:yes gene_type:complete
LDKSRNKFLRETSASYSEFDEVSSNYEKHLGRGLSLSGENSCYFARRRIEHMFSIGKSDSGCRAIMDFGSGTGGSVGDLLEIFRPKTLTAVDVSEQSLKILKGNYNTPRVIIESPSSLHPNSNFDFCFTNGVFHHIPPSERKQNAKIIYDSIKSGGHLYFWENNPWNPATHWVMSRILFDQNAIKVFPHQAVKLLHEVGFQVELIHYLFIFPNFLRLFRPLEKLMKNFPIGCQYLLLAKKP